MWGTPSLQKESPSAALPRCGTQKAVSLPKALCRVWLVPCLIPPASHTRGGAGGAVVMGGNIS